MRGWVRDRSLGLVLWSLFLVSWIAQAFTQAAEFIDDEADHRGERLTSVWGAFADADYWEAFWRATLENWQSEFLQLAAFVTLTVWLVMKGSSESRDTDERLEAKLDAILDALPDARSPVAVTRSLPPKYQR